MSNIIQTRPHNRLRLSNAARFPLPPTSRAREGTFADVSVRVLSSVCMRRRTEPRNAGLWFRADCAGLTAWSNRRGTSGTVGGIPHRESTAAQVFCILPLEVPSSLTMATRSPILLIGWNENGLVFSRKLLIDTFRRGGSLAPHSQDFFVPALLRERGTVSRGEQAALRQRGSSRLVQAGGRGGIGRRREN